MLYVFVRGSQRKTCETRLSADGSGYELVVAEDGVERVDRYNSMQRLLAREHELLQAWRAQGWAHPQRKPGPGCHRSFQLPFPERCQPPFDVVRYNLTSVSVPVGRRTEGTCAR